MKLYTEEQMSVARKNLTYKIAPLGFDKIECSKCKQDFVVNADKTEKKRMAIYLSYHKENDDEN